MQQMLTVLTRTIILFFLSIVWLPDVYGQSGQPLLSFDLKKPKKYEDKELPSEKSANKKFTTFRRFTQNGVTKFNWHFNANVRLEKVVEKAKLQHKDDYSELLSFYNYSLDKTAQDKSELDSVIYKANAGILIHDLRNTWIDNMYMLMGKAYYYRKDLDSAYLTFQYINYAFAPKEKDGYDKPIGSNANDEGNAFSISTKEKTDLFHKTWSRPPSRNESLIWQVRTYLAKDELPEAAGLIETLRTDPNFPDRLKTDLQELRAWWFYKQEMYDSAAVCLEKALGNAENREEHARWEYLIGQLYERAGKHDMAAEFFGRAVNHTLNPVLEVYARLNVIRQNKGDEKVIKKNIEDLLKMAKKDRYLYYRDIIYYTAAKIELERNNIPGAKALLLKASKYASPTGDVTQRTKTFLLLGDLAFSEKNYPEAKSFYDSITVDPGGLRADLFEKKKQVLAKVVSHSNVIYRQDSLQKLAALPHADREVFIKKLVKQLRKNSGLKEDENAPGQGSSTLANRDNAPVDLFGTNAKGEWYFYNDAVKAKGFSEFKNKWGSRPNVDNWRRLSAANQNKDRLGLANKIAGEGTPETIVGINVTYEDLLKNVPLTPEKLKVSNDSIETAQFLLAKVYMEGLEDYELAIATFESFLQRFPYSNDRPEALQHLYYCYTKTGNTAKAEEIKKELNLRFKGTEAEKKINNASNKAAYDEINIAMAASYDSIYNKFIEGNFEEALAQKKIADSLYGNNYWTPQLLYIQAVYYIRQRQDDSAHKVLGDIIKLYPNSKLAPKAQNLSEVLGRRQQIEDYLTKLEVHMPTDDSTAITPQQQVTAPPAKIPSGQTPPPPIVSNQPPPVVQKPAQKVTRTDSTQARPNAPLIPAFTLKPEVPHFAVVVLDKVDPVYVREAGNAFNRYNKTAFYNKVINISSVDISNDIKFVMMSGFDNAGAAVEYVEKARKAAPTEVPWLPANKYSFIIITAENLEILKASKDVNAYKQFLIQSFPGKF